MSSVMWMKQTASQLFINLDSKLRAPDVYSTTSCQTGKVLELAKEVQGSY